MISAMFALSFISCSKCKNDAKDAEKQDTTAVVDSTAGMVVERVTATDREYMFTNYGGDYRWFESCIVLKNFLDEENDGEITGISNVFQVVEEKEKGADTFVILAAHVADSTAYEVKHGFWVEDYPMNDEDIKVTFAQAFEKLNQVNLPKPHSKQCVLRKQVGPKACNPQYIFGNVKAQIYVDAITGDVTDVNPAFGDIKLETPLGEWP